MAVTGYQYPFTKMNFVVSCDGMGSNDDISSVAAFTEITGIDGTAEVIEFRQGNAKTWTPVKMPGLVKHGNVTFKMGYIVSSQFLGWAQQCVSDTRGEIPRKNLKIELTNQINTGTTPSTSIVWTLNNAFVTKYSAPDMNSTANEVAIATMEVAYEELTLPMGTSAPGGSASTGV